MGYFYFQSGTLGSQLGTVTLFLTHDGQPHGPAAALSIAGIKSQIAGALNTNVITPNESTIPNGAVVVYLATDWGRLWISTELPTCPGLTFTRRASVEASGIDVATAIFTAVASSELSGVDRVVTFVGQDAAETHAGSLIVLTGANTGALTNAGSNTGTGTSATVVINAAAAGSYILGAMFTYTTTLDVGANTTEIYGPASPNANLHCRNTSVTSGAGNVTLTGTLGGSSIWAASAIEIQKA